MIDCQVHWYSVCVGDILEILPSVDNITVFTVISYSSIYQYTDAYDYWNLLLQLLYGNLL